MLSKTNPRICGSILNLTSTSSFSPQCLRFITTAPQFSSTTTQHLSQQSHAFHSSSASSSPSFQSSLRSISTPTSPTTTSPLPPSSSATEQQSLTWDAYLRLRRKRRHYNLLASVLTSMNTTAAGVTFLSSQNFELMNIFGLDPFLVLGAFTAISGGVGWLLGPFVGNVIFGIVYRRIRGSIAAVSHFLSNYLPNADGTSF